MKKSVVLLALAASSLSAQPPGGRGGPPPVVRNPQGLPISPAPEYVRTDAPTDPVIQKIWDEGMQRSQAASLAQQLMDSIGPRLTGSPNMTRGQDWLLATYKQWGVPARKEQYGTWNSWNRGATFVQLTAPRVKPLEATMMSWSGNTAGKWVEGEVVTLKPYATPEEFKAWLPNVKGKIVLASAPRLSCRMPAQVQEFAMASTLAALDSAQRDLTATYAGLTQRVPTFYADVKAAGAVAVFESNWSQFPGIDKVFGSPRNAALPTIDIGCEDYGLLFRLAQNRQGPKIKMLAESQALGEKPVFNVVAEIKGSSKPDEYVVLSAHFDSWEGHSGATDNGTGTITMLEALRILKTVLPNPSRTIVVGHWSGEEQGLNGSGLRGRPSRGDQGAAVRVQSGQRYGTHREHRTEHSAGERPASRAVHEADAGSAHADHPSVRPFGHRRWIGSCLVPLPWGARGQPRRTRLGLRQHHVAHESRLL